MAQNQIDTLNFRHEAIVDMMLAHPEMKQNDIANKLDLTPAWLSTVVNSDAFRVYYEKRREEYTLELHNKTVRKLYDVALAATEVVLEALGEDEVDPRFALDAKDKSLHRLGYGPSKGNVVLNQNNIVNQYPVDSELLQQARERINGKHRPVLEGQAEEVQSCGEDN